MNPPSALDAMSEEAVLSAIHALDAGPDGHPVPPTRILRGLHRVFRLERVRGHRIPCVTDGGWRVAVREQVWLSLRVAAGRKAVEDYRPRRFARNGRTEPVTVTPGERWEASRRR